MIRSLNLSIRLSVVVLCLLGAAPRARADVAANLCFRTPADFQALAYDPRSRMAFVNTGGLFDGGVCWWHSRMQRAALYLAMFRPDLPRYSQPQYAQIIHELAGTNQVIVIPGYANFNEFSADFKREIQSELNAWQLFDGIVDFRWVDGLEGHDAEAATRLRQTMDGIYQSVAVQHHIPFEKLSLPGIGAHAYLVIGASQTDGGGYGLDVIDSNDPSAVRHISYSVGQTSLVMPDTGEEFLPYLDYTGDMTRINKAVHGYCGKMYGASYVSQDL